LEQDYRRFGEIRENLSDGRGQRSMEDHGLGLGVIEEIPKLCADVAVVDVERGGSRQIGADHSLEILRTVIKGQRHVVLARFVATEVATLAMGSESMCSEIGGQPSGPLCDLGIREAPVADHEAVPIRNGFGDCREHEAKVEGVVCLGVKHPERVSLIEGPRVLSDRA
jgi:hypothetical protein